MELGQRSHLRDTGPRIYCLGSWAVFHALCILECTRHENRRGCLFMGKKERRPRQEDHCKFEASLGYRMRL